MSEWKDAYIHAGPIHFFAVAKLSWDAANHFFPSPLLRGLVSEKYFIKFVRLLARTPQTG